MSCHAVSYEAQRWLESIEHGKRRCTSESDSFTWHDNGCHYLVRLLSTMQSRAYKRIFVCSLHLRPWTTCVSYQQFCHVRNIHEVRYLDRSTLLVKMPSICMLSICLVVIVFTFTPFCFPLGNVEDKIGDWFMSLTMANQVIFWAAARICSFPCMPRLHLCVAKKLNIFGCTIVAFLGEGIGASCQFYIFEYVPLEK